MRKKKSTEKQQRITDHKRITDHGGFGFEERNEPGNSILDFALSYDLILTNT